MRAVPGIAVLVVGLLVASGCGDGGRLGAREYHHEVGHLCAKANARLSDLHLPPFNGPHGGAALEHVVRLGRDTLSQIRDIKPPKDGQAAVDEWLATYEQVIDEADYASRLVRSGDVIGGFEAAARASALAPRVAELERAIGIRPACLVPNLVVAS
jgi:hypothetical protein